jgi:hypothetical protein
VWLCDWQGLRDLAGRQLAAAVAAEEAAGNVPALGFLEVRQLAPLLTPCAFSLIYPSPVFKVRRKNMKNILLER